MSEAAREPRRQKHRISPIPRMPMLRPAHTVLDEGTGSFGITLWRILTDMELWLGCDGEPTELFSAPSPYLTHVEDSAEIAESVAALLVVSRDPARVVAGRLADACQVVWEWAERRDHSETALQFAEMAARLDPESPARCSTAGRLSRRMGEAHRGTMWYCRAARLARAQDNDHAFAVAQLGWSNLEQDLGNLREAEFHAVKAYRAALRVGRKTDAAYAFHALCTILIHQERYTEGWAFGRNALASYPVSHPRFPAFAHDLAFLMCRLGYFSSALPVLAAVLPCIGRINERHVVLANVARAAAASGHRVTFERSAGPIWEAVDHDADVPSSALYHLAEACRTYEMWDRSTLLAERALATATRRGHKIIIGRATRLLAGLDRRERGDIDMVPQEGSDVDAVRELLLRKLQKHTSLGVQPGTVPPEKYPIN